jgi:orotidine 5'-phosphate decarboxylase subfamily 1
MFKNNLIVAIDKSDLNEAKNLCKELQDDVGCFKLGLEFFYSFGKDGINEIAKFGVPIFLDLKLHDIPNTVLKSTLALFNNLNGVNILTLHASGGIEMMKKTNQALLENLTHKPMLFGVTVLTSIGEVDLWEGKKVTFPFALGILRAINKLEKLHENVKIKNFIENRLTFMVKIANNTLNYWLNIYPQEQERINKANDLFKTNHLISHLNLNLECNYESESFYKSNHLSAGILNQVLQLSNLASQSNIEGIVCSGMEAKFVKNFFPKLQIITPGIRPQWYNTQDDQSRTLTPKEAIENGSNYLVIGRPITESINPKEAVKQTLLEINS